MGEPSDIVIDADADFHIDNRRHGLQPGVPPRRHRALPPRLPDHGTEVTR